MTEKEHAMLNQLKNWQSWQDFLLSMAVICCVLSGYAMVMFNAGMILDHEVDSAFRFTVITLTMSLLSIVTFAIRAVLIHKTKRALRLESNSKK